MSERLFTVPEEKLVRRIVFSCGAVTLIGLGVCMFVWPAWIILKSRDDDDKRPLTSGELWTIRLVGVGIILGSGYGLYALLTGMPGADFLTP